MIEKYILDNGLCVLLDHEAFFKTFSMGFWIKAGSIYENDENNGYTHLLEHMLFKGTNKRSYLDISKEIDTAGGHINAFTEREHTCFYVQLMNHHLDLGTDILWDMLSHSVIDEAELEKEKMVVIEEIKMYEDTPDELIYDLFITNIWKGHPLGYPILGNIDNIERADRSKVSHFFNHLYTPENIVVSISGNFDQKHLLKQLESFTFRQNHRSKTNSSFSALNMNSVKSHQIKDLEQVYFIYGYPTFNRHDPRRYALFILNNILGGGSSSRLFLEVREKLGLAYSIYSFHGLYEDGGVLGISSSTGLENYPVVLETVSKEIDKLIQTGITEEELYRSKEQMKGGIAFAQENLEARMNRNAKYEMNYNQYISYEEIISRIDEVTVTQVNNLINEILTVEPYAFYSLGPEGHNEVLLSKT